jgi:hypothetical protein
MASSSGILIERSRFRRRNDVASWSLTGKLPHRINVAVTTRLLASCIPIPDSSMQHRINRGCSSTSRTTNNFSEIAIKWTRLSCCEFHDNEVRLQLFALAYDLANFLRRSALPKSIKHWTLTTLREKLIARSRYVTFQMAEPCYRSCSPLF